MSQTNIKYSNTALQLWEDAKSECENCNISEKIIAEDIIKWFLPIVFNGQKILNSAIMNSKVEKVKDLARHINFDPKRVNELIEEYKKGIK